MNKFVSCLLFFIEFWDLNIFGLWTPMYLYLVGWFWCTCVRPWCICRTFKYFYLFVGPWYGWKWMWWRSLVSRCAHKLLHHSHTSQLKLPKHIQIRKYKYKETRSSEINVALDIYNHLLFCLDEYRGFLDDWDGMVWLS